MTKEKNGRVFSGVQPTGLLHLGNYLGALRPFAKLQKSYQCLYCVVDAHAITTPFDPKILTHHTRLTAAAFIACGVEPEHNIIFTQTMVPEHAEMAWLLGCVVRIGWLNRMTQFKEKAGRGRENASLGLYAYPVLMAADILLYKATHVPVGEDQKQHLELTRDIAQKFNTDFATRSQESFFPLPKPVTVETASRVMSLRDGSTKMSKSDPSDLSRLSLTDSDADIAKKIAKAKTDPHPLPDNLQGLQGRAEAANLLGIYAALEEIPLQDAIQRYAGASFSSFKQDLTARAVETLAPIREKIQGLMENPKHLDVILQEGGAKARDIAHPIMKSTKQVMGFLQA